MKERDQSLTNGALAAQTGTGMRPLVPLYRLIVCLIFSLAPCPPGAMAQDPDKAPSAGESPDDRESARVRAKTKALETAHALAVAENGTRRNALWEGWLGESGGNVIPVQLFHGHRYYFVLGSGGAGKTPDIHIFDGRGHRVPFDIHSGEGRTIAFLSPAESGTYYLRVRPAEGKGGSAIALTYVYR